MSEMFQFFNQGWVGSLIGVIGIALGIMGIFSYRISKSIAKPSYQKSSLRLIGREEDNLPSEVTVTYKGKVVERLTKTTLILWNNGSESLDGKNIVAADPLTLKFDEQDNILSYNIIKRTKDVNGFSIEKNENSPRELFLSFDYLDPDDGVVIELLHDSANKYPELTGTIKGLPNGFVDHGRVMEKRSIKGKGVLGLLLNNHKFIFAVAIAIGLAFTIFGLLPQEWRDLMLNTLPESEKQKSITEQPLFFIVFGLLYSSMPAFLLWLRRKKYPKQLEALEIEP